jgi:uncharacterized cysteine cluster protein YcgN (CxxCxxCC family)
VTPWWNRKALAELDPGEWEALCDGCAKCCLHKLENEDTGEVCYTRVRCRYLDEARCRCTVYENRSARVPNCIHLSPDELGELTWLPATCAYRLRSEGRPLPSWHYLESGSRETVHQAGVSIRGRALSEEYVHPDGFEEHIVQWVE